MGRGFCVLKFDFVGWIVCGCVLVGGVLIGGWILWGVWVWLYYLVQVWFYFRMWWCIGVVVDDDVVIFQYFGCLIIVYIVDYCVDFGQDWFQ